MKVNLGRFINESGKFIVSDPCYEDGAWYQGKISNIKTGTWDAYIIKSDEGVFGQRNAELIAKHSSLDDDRGLDWELCDFIVGVDSGQAGIFDANHYNNDSVFGKGEKPVHDYGETKFYGFCCDLTLSETQGGVLKYGAVATSGFGDGSYNCFISKDRNGKVVAVKIIFIQDDYFE